METESVSDTVRAMNAVGHKTKSWTSENGKIYTGGVFTKRAILYILQNPVYAGKIVHKGKVYQGKHQPIIKQEIWEKAQAIFTRKETRVINSATRMSAPPMLKGIFYCSCCGSKMTPSYSMKKNGSRYRYYICSSKKRLANESCTVGSIAAAEVEKTVTDQVLRLLAKPEIIAHVIAINANTEDTERLEDIQIIKALQCMSKIWDELFPIEQVRITHLLIKQVVISEDNLDISIYSDGLNDLGNEISGSSDKLTGKAA